MQESSCVIGKTYLIQMVYIKVIPLVVYGQEVLFYFLHPCLLGLEYKIIEVELQYLELSHDP